MLLLAAGVAVAGGCAGGKKKQKARDARRTAAAGPPLMRHEFALPGLGRDFRVVVYCPDEEAAYRAEKAAFDELAALEGLFDTSRPDSEVSQIHANAGLGAVRVSDLLYDVLKEGVRLTNASDGAIDVTAGAYDALWRAAAANERTLADADLAAADALVGVEKLRLDPIDRTAHLTVAGMRLELSALVGGIACDRILRSLSRAGFPIALVDANGRIALGDAPPGTAGWRIEVTNAPRKSKTRVLHLSRRGIASSGRVGDVVVIDGQTYSRVLNPQTGIGATNLSAATVVARRAWQADALARAAAVLGEEPGRRLVSSVRNARVSFHGPPAAAARAPARETPAEPAAATSP